MDIFRPALPKQGATLNSVANADPRLQPTPDYGTDGSGCGANPVSRPVPSGRSQKILVAAIGIFLAGLAAGAGSIHAPGSRLAHLSSNRDAASPTVSRDPQEVDRLKPQKQAEALLELAVGRSDGAADQISSRVDHWQGKIKWNPQIATLTTAALNSNDMRVRESGIEVQLAAYGLAKNSASLGYLLKSAESSNHARRIWGLWALGLMGNRGIEPGRVVQVLSAHLKDSDEDSRRWAVDGLALVGSAETIPLLLQTMHDDPSPDVRERAACSLAGSGMLTPEQRAGAVPQLLNYTDDPALDAQTHAWAFEALEDITHQRLPNDSAAWRSWYENQGPGVRGQ
jgi:hypothetical protein